VGKEQAAWVGYLAETVVLEEGLVAQQQDQQVELVAQQVVLAGRQELSRAKECFQLPALMLRNPLQQVKKGHGIAMGPRI
jgi:type IV secretory pathway protease TraF